MNVDIFSLIIGKIDPTDKKTFNSLRLLCKTSWKACVNHSMKLLKLYNEELVYVYFHPLDGWGGCYQAEYSVANSKPTPQQIDPLLNSHIVFMSTRKELSRVRSHLTCDCVDINLL